MWEAFPMKRVMVLVLVMVGVMGDHAKKYRPRDHHHKGQHDHT
jgi:hypothetical protein